MASPDAVTLRTDGPIAILTLNQPKQLNAMTQDDYFLLATLLRQVATMPSILATVLTGTGRFFSAGANVQKRSALQQSADDASSPGADRRNFLRGFVSNNLEVTQAFATHPKILVTALNGPAVGLSAAVIAYSDFIYAAPHAYLLTPFTSLGLVAEGGASRTFVERLGIAKANEALIMSKRITCPELVNAGFVNKVFEGVKPGEDQKFLNMVLEEVKERLVGGHLNGESLLLVKDLIRRPTRVEDERQQLAEVLGGLERFVKGAPQKEFADIASGRKKHKL